jgi:hypothetical protein
MYKLIAPLLPKIDCTSVLRIEDNAAIPFVPSNTDYELFKSQINNETATLETADGILMSPEEAKAYVATLP